jgi:hypothetical protein
MIKIHFERTGGLLGDDIHLDLDLGRMPDEEAQTLQQLLLDADFYGIPENLDGASTPDDFRYVISVRGGQSEHTVRTTTTTMPGALSPLVAALSVIHAVEEDEQQHTGLPKK